MVIKEQNVIIHGPGVSGLAAARLCLKEEAKVTLVGSGDPSMWKADGLSGCELKTEDEVNFDQSFDLYVLSPGIPRTHRLVVKANERGIPVISEIELAYRFCKIPIMAITGSNGKTTTTLLTQKILESCGKRVFVGGNIGTPFCDLILAHEKYDIALLELSSFQLESIDKFRANIASFLNLSFHHGERYGDIETYEKAKLRIFQNQKEDDSKFDRTIDKSILNNFNLGSFKLAGEHNRENLAFALSMAKSFLKEDFNISSIQEAINTFEPAPHRFEIISQSDDCIVINDSKSTNWEATASALKSSIDFGKSITLIIGGKKRGRGDEMKEYKDIFLKASEKIIVFGEVAELLFSEFSSDKVIKCESVKELKDRLILKETILFSPGFPSFDEFKNYSERGEAFKKLISELSCG